MRRNLARLANETFDLLIIGGGITGACVARDAALRGLRVALVEKNDFANATSAHNSKLIHGGLRYLRNFELSLVRESLSERRIWERIAPHLVHPLPFLLPVFGGGRRARATLSAGLTLYDTLAYDRGWLKDVDQRLPGHRWIKKEVAAQTEPLIERTDLEGAFLYYDAQMYSPERLALECLADAANHGATLANYVEATGLLQRNGRVEGCSVREAESGDRFDVRAATTLVATGPWADLFLGHALGKEPSHKLTRSKGIHVIVPAMTRGHAVTVAADSGHFFVLPWQGHTLLGTTDTTFNSDPDSVSVSRSDIADFFSFVNKHLPNASLGPATVEHFYAGLRPLVADGRANTYAASRRSELVDHGKSDGAQGLFSAIGGKWTTSRHLAQKIVDAVAAKGNRALRPCETARALLPGAKFERFANFLAREKYTHSLPSTEHLARLYGARLSKMLSVADARPELRRPLGERGDIAAQVVYATREEMALTLEDVVMRRTSIGQLGPPSEAVIDEVSMLMAAELEWTEERRAREIASIAPRFSTSEAA